MSSDLVKKLRDDQTIAETLPHWPCDNLQATMHAAADRIEELEREVWQWRIDFGEMHRDYKEMRARVAELETGGVHTCHDECPRLPCVQAREIARLRGLIAGLITA